MTLIRKTTVTVAVALMTLAVSATAALAQVNGETAQIPEAAPKNWSVQFLGEPLVAAAVVASVAAVLVYALRLIKVRYPRGS